MFDIRVVFSLCFLFAAFILNGLTTIYIMRLNKEVIEKQNIYVFSIVLLFHSLYAFIAILVWSDWDFVDAGAPFATLYGPLLWHLTQMNKNKKHRLQKLKWHFLPFVVFSIGYVYCLAYPIDEGFMSNYTWYFYLFAGVQFAFYLILSIIVMGKIKPSEEATGLPKEPFFNYLYILAALTIFLFLTSSLDQLIFTEEQTQIEQIGRA